MHIKYVSNTQDVKTHYNVIMNSNYANFGGLFDNQTEDEMFRRFHIIEKKKVSKEITNKIYKYLHNKRVMDAIIVKIITLIKSTIFFFILPFLNYLYLKIILFFCQIIYLLEVR